MILGIESSTRTTSVALYGESGLLAEYTYGFQRTHSEQLLPAIQTLLQDAGVEGRELQGVAVSVGPGSFTGVRVAVCTAKGIASAWRVPVIPVSSLAGLAHRFSGAKGRICALLDARKGEVYAGLFLAKNGVIHSVAPERVLAPGTLCEEICDETLFVGEGALRYQDLILERLPSLAVIARGTVLHYLSAASIAEIGYRLLSEGRTLDPAALIPNYIRRSEAEIQWKNKPGRTFSTRNKAW